MRFVPESFRPTVSWSRKGSSGTVGFTYGHLIGEPSGWEVEGKLKGGDIFPVWTEMMWFHSVCTLMPSSNKCTVLRIHPRPGRHHRTGTIRHSGTDRHLTLFTLPVGLSVTTPPSHLSPSGAEVSSRTAPVLRSTSTRITRVGDERKVHCVKRDRGRTDKTRSCNHRTTQSRGTPSWTGPRTMESTPVDGQSFFCWSEVLYLDYREIFERRRRIPVTSLLPYTGRMRPRIFHRE